MLDDMMKTTTYSVAFAERRDIGREWNDVKWDKHHREIQYHRLYMLTAGKATVRMHSGVLELVPGNVYFIPAFSILESSIDGKMNKYYIHFGADSHIFDMYRYICERYSAPATDITDALFRTVVDNYANNSWSSHLKVQGAMNLLLSDFLDGVDADRSEISRFESVLKYINKHYTEDIHLCDLAEIMNISTMYFSNSFKATFNISPKQYILNKRLTESQRLLLETSMTVKEIAYAVGFENENYFSEFFSAKIGISALKFRNRQLPKTRESIL